MRNRYCFTPVIVLMLVVAASSCSKKQATVVTDAAVSNFSIYVPMPDGVNLAVDVWLPGSKQSSARIPAVVEFTRYWRATEMQPPSNRMPEEIQQSLDHGFAYVLVDVRGSGASFGIREAEFSLAEVRDMPHVVDWIAEQSWSNGKVISMGISYSGNTTELTGLYKSPSLIAAVPRFTDYDWYTSIVIPGGIKNAYITERWGAAVHKLDLNDVSLFGEHKGEITAENPKVVGVKPVDADTDRTRLAAASNEHKNNRSLADNLGELTYRDEYPSATGLDDASGKAVSIHNFRDEFESSALPMYHWGSWFDAGTAAGILARFTRFDAPYQYVIGAWSHGARFDANPYHDEDAPVDPSVDEQYDRIFGYARKHMDDSMQTAKKELSYFTVGENIWKSTATWPPEGHSYQRMWFGSESALQNSRPEADDGSDSYKVDFSTGTGMSSRWSTQLGGGDVWYGDRSDADELLLTYTSEPLDDDIELTGTAIVSLQLSSSHEDGAIIAYLEDVAPDGFVRMLTEGEIRLIHRLRDGNMDSVFGPMRSFEKEDGQKWIPDQVAEVKFALLPISALIRKGHSIRIAIAGHDKDTFIRIPVDGDPEIRIEHSAQNASYIDLPVIHRP